MLPQKQTPQGMRISNTILNNPAPTVDLNVYHDPAYGVARVAQQIVLHPDTQHEVLLTKKSHGLLTIKPKTMTISRHRALTARRIDVMSPEQLFYNFVSNFSEKQICLLKRMKIAQWEPLQTVYMLMTSTAKTFPN